MGLSWGFRDGLIFAPEMRSRVFLHQGAYSYGPRRPAICERCLSDSGSFHAHGRYKRWLKTIKNLTLTRVRIWRHRWLCLCCGRTMSTGPPDVVPHVPLCTMVIAVLLWAYLDGGKGIHTCIPQGLDEAADPRTLARYLKRAIALGLKTQQAVREVLIEQKEPGPWEELFKSGLSPPESLLNRHREPSQAAILWRALSMLHNGSKTLSANPCLLMARARQKAEKRRSRFLV
jgi:hypothetical protein